MAYVHCHSCDWSQDDFWNRHYNPLRYFFRTDLREWGWPRMYNLDPVTSYGRVFSWYVLWKHFARWIRCLLTQKWWTYASWKRAIAKNGGHWPACPKCGDHNLDID